jgi:group II intron reverse transcriptase/maturase
VSQALEHIRRIARERKKERFTALFHHLNIDLLEEAFFELKEDAAPGVDRLTWTDYEADLKRTLENLHGRVQRGAYRALPSRRVYIPKPDGGQRPLAVAALEDKIVQRAVLALLNAIYEEDFLGISYGFRPGRGTHDALDALCVGIDSRKVSWIVDADIRSFFDEISQEWLTRFLEHRIGDRRIIRLIQKWLKAGVLEAGAVSVSDKGTGQGSVISPLLANIYLHYALDLWAVRWRRREATGDMVIVRYAEDFIVGFQHEIDARRFLDEMRERLRKFALSLHPEKTRIIEFGRFAAERRKRRGLGKPETFDFLGFTFICGKTHAGKFQVKRKRLEILRELVPGAVRVSLLIGSNVLNAETTLRDVEPAARAMRLQIQVFNAATRQEIEAVFASFPRERPDALFVASDTFLTTPRVQLVNLTARHGIPTAADEVIE